MNNLSYHITANHLLIPSNTSESAITCFEIKLIKFKNFVVMGKKKVRVVIFIIDTHLFDKIKAFYNIPALKLPSENIVK